MVAKPLFQGWQPSWKSILSIADNLLSPNTVVPCRESWCKSQDIPQSKSQFSHCLPTSSKSLTAEKVSGEHSLCHYPLQQCYSNKKTQKLLLTSVRLTIYEVGRLRSHSGVMSQTVCPILPNPYVKPSPPGPENVTALGDRAFKEVSKLKQSHQGEP